MSNLYPYLITIGAILLMMFVWIVVQLAWKRTFPEVGGDEDALAGRTGCAGCSHDGHCDTQSKGRHEIENCDLNSDIVRDSV